MHPLFPYVAGAFACLAFIGLSLAVSSYLAFRDEVRGWQSGAEARALLAHEKLQDRIGAAQLAIERQAGELRAQRLSLPPPGPLTPRRRVLQTSPDWDDGDGRATQVRPAGPPPLPSFELFDQMYR
jgi:hypothetical protein